MKSLIQTEKGGPDGKLRGHDGRTDPVATVVEGDIIKTVMSPGLAAGVSRFDSDIVDRLTLAWILSMDSETGIVEAGLIFCTLSGKAMRYCF
jgi:hypothetical protein